MSDEKHRNRALTEVLIRLILLLTDAISMIIISRTAGGAPVGKNRPARPYLSEREEHQYGDQSQSYLNGKAHWERSIYH